MLNHTYVDIYRLSNKEAGEKIPEADEEGHYDCSHLITWSKGNNHHAIECEVHKAHEHEEEKPKEILNLPIEPNHSIK